MTPLDRYQVRTPLLPLALVLLCWIGIVVTVCLVLTSWALDRQRQPPPPAPIRSAPPSVRL